LRRTEAQWLRDLRQMLIRQNVWRTAFSRSACALPLNLI
jgi:hypothetical protein